MQEPQKINLANLPTPIQRLHFKGCEFFIKRDDFTGVELTGNKVRKLEYLLYDARRLKSDYIFTSGGDQSNHARATSIAASSIGLKSKLFLWGNKNQTPKGNLFLDKLVNPEIRFLSKKQFYNVQELMYHEELEFKKNNKKVYVIPSGGSSTLGIWGYINFVNELATQTNVRRTKGIVLAAGTGGTAAGILIGCALLGIKMKVFVVNVLSNKEEIYNEINKLVENCILDFKLKVKVDYNLLEIFDGYSKEGYKSITQEKINLSKSFFKETGILLDPTYTGKAFYAYQENFLQSKKKTDIMFLHTGGIFGAFAKMNFYLD